MALTLQPIRDFPLHCGETRTRLTTAIDRRLSPRLFLRGGVCTQVIHKRLSSRFFLGEGASVHKLTLLYAQETTIARMRSHFCFPDRLLILNENYLELDFQTARKKGFCRNSRNFLTAGH